MGKQDQRLANQDQYLANQDDYTTPFGSLAAFPPVAHHPCTNRSDNRQARWSHVRATHSDAPFQQRPGERARDRPPLEMRKPGTSLEFLVCVYCVENPGLTSNSRAGDAVASHALIPRRVEFAVCPRVFTSETGTNVLSATGH